MNTQRHSSIQSAVSESGDGGAWTAAVGAALAAEEFGRLAIEQLDTLSRVAAGMTRNRSAADDLVQETYLRALRAREQFRPREYGMRPWMLRIMHNVHVTRAAREQKQPASTDPSSLDAGGGGAGDGRFPSIPMELDDTVRGAMGELPADLRTALTLWAVEELSYKEMADVMAVPIGTVMSRLHRARRSLAAILCERAPELMAGLRVPCGG